MKYSMYVLFAAALFMTAQNAEADRAHVRNNNQQKRIAEGIESGELNPNEAKHLEAQQAHIHKLEHKAAADGTVTKKEKVRIEVAQDHASNTIARKKHNRR